MITSVHRNSQRETARASAYGFLALGAVLLRGCTGPVTPSRTYIPAEQNSPTPALVASAWADTAKSQELLNLTDRLVRLPLARQHDAARRLVRHFFDAVASGDRQLVLEFMTPTALAYDYRGRERPLSQYWIDRLRKFDYAKTADLHVVWLSDFHVVEARSSPRSEIPEPLGSAPDDLFVLVPIERTHVESQQLFGQRIWFRLSRGSEGLRISGYLEDFAPD